MNIRCAVVYRILVETAAISSFCFVYRTSSCLPETFPAITSLYSPPDSHVHAATRRGTNITFCGWQNAAVATASVTNTRRRSAERPLLRRPTTDSAEGT